MIVDVVGWKEGVDTRGREEAEMVGIIKVWVKIEQVAEEHEGEFGVIESS